MITFILWHNSVDAKVFVINSLYPYTKHAEM